MNAKQLRALIGKRVEWTFAYCPRRGTSLVGTGIVEEVQGKNVLISGDWKWYPDLKNLKPFDNS